MALDKSAADIYSDLMAASPSSAPSFATVCRSARHFSNGHSTIKDNRGKFKASPVSTDETVARVKELVDADPRISCEYIASELGLSSATAFRILKHKLCYKKVCSRWVPHVLTPENKRLRVAYCRQLLQVYGEGKPKRLDNIVTGDETWVYFYEPLRKQQTKAWVPKDGNPPEMPRRDRSEKKVLYTVFYNTTGIVFQKPREQNKSITGRYYRDVVLADLKRFYETARPASGMRGIKLLHDNAPAHKAKLVQEYLEAENIETLPHPPYSPDLAPCDFFLFPHLKRCLAGRRFSNRSALGTAVYQCFQHIPKTDFKRSFLSWVDRL